MAQSSTPTVIVTTPDELRALVAEAVADALVTASPKSDGPQLLDRRGLAQALGCGVDTVDKLRRDGLPTLLVGDSPRFDFAEVVAWLRGRRAA